MAPMSAAARAPGPRPSFRDFLRYFATLGMWGFGGSAAVVGYIQQDLVERRRWVRREEFLNGVALGQLMPGPLSVQVMMWIGYLQRGVLGALFVSLAFILPSFVFALALGAIYEGTGRLEIVRAVSYGVAPAAIALITIASTRLALLTNQAFLRLWTVSVIVFGVTVLTGVEIAALFVAAGVVMVLIEAPPPFLRRSAHVFVPMLASTSSWLPATEASGTFLALALLFVKSGAFVFGSSLSVIPLLHSTVVDVERWLTEDEFLDVIAVTVITPGGIIVAATLIGYLVAGVAGAFVATGAMLLPILLGVAVPGALIVRHQRDPAVTAFVRGATAAAAGAVAGVAVVLARTAISDMRTAGIAVAAFVLLYRSRWKPPQVVLLAGLAGVILR